MENEKHGAVIALHREGVPNSEIAKRLRMPRSTVHDAVKRLRQLVDCRDRSNTSNSVSEARIRPQMAIRKRISRNPQRSMRKMVSDPGLSEKTVRRVVKEDLNLRPSKIQKIHCLNERMKLKRLQKVRKMRRMAADGRHRRIHFTDEKCSRSIHLITTITTTFYSRRNLEELGTSIH
ncbi:hypothetical protein ANCDUO_00267 [Ancylostoma duodenale]|uniref:Transposase IS30-like HTH domain-containing protein n=1 Tax=Ancylostoma duodenale TaxID=51022 RepID=A0A0C2DHG7_9BILA|nr:hypothetical protein ANCDUO_00267 [Ancylostoma duodenale]